MINDGKQWRRQFWDLIVAPRFSESIKTRFLHSRAAVDTDGRRTTELLITETIDVPPQDASWEELASSLHALMEKSKEGHIRLRYHEAVLEVSSRGVRYKISFHDGPTSPIQITKRFPGEARSSRVGRDRVPRRTRAPPKRTTTASQPPDEPTITIDETGMWDDLTNGA